MKKTEITVSEELIRGARVTSNKLPAELSAAICAGCILGYALMFLILILW